MAYVDDLIAQQETLLQLNSTYASVIADDSAMLAEVLAQTKPSYNIDGQSVSWTEYAAMLQASIEEMSASIKSNIETLDLLTTLIIRQQPYQFQSATI